MDILELRMNYTAFIKLRNFIKINDISAEIKEYKKKDDVVTGKLDVTGTYLSEDLIKSNKFFEEIPFNIIFSNSDYEILDIDCVNLDYQTIDGRGIEVMFDVHIKYETQEKEEQIIEVPVLTKEDPVKVEEITEEEYEEIKNERENEIDQLITEELSQVVDNIPSDFEETNEILEKTERMKTIKVCYYNDSSELDKVCDEQKVAIDKIFNDNKNTDFVKYRRVIIK